MGTKRFIVTILAFLIMLNLHCQWQTNGNNISYNLGHVSIDTKTNWASLNIGPGSYTWGTSLSLGADLLKGGQTYSIFSLGGDAPEGQGKLLIRNKGANDFTAVLLLDSMGNFGIGTEYPSAKLQVKDGDVYIENINKGIIMKSPNSQCWRGTLDNTGNLAFSSITCPENSKTTKAKEIKITGKATIYPNPTENSITISIKDYNGEILTALITNSSGQTINKKLINSNLTTINTLNMSKGMYILSIEDKNGNSISSNKIIKE
jgi:hypothetical protein